MMVFFKDFLAAEKHYQDLLREAEQERLVRSALAALRDQKRKSKKQQSKPFNAENGALKNND